MEDTSSEETYILPHTAITDTHAITADIKTETLTAEDVKQQVTLDEAYILPDTWIRETHIKHDENIKTETFTAEAVKQEVNIKHQDMDLTLNTTDEVHYKLQPGSSKTLEVSEGHIAHLCYICGKSAKACEITAVTLTHF